MTDKQQSLIRTIEGHGHSAYVSCDHENLIVASYDNHSVRHTEVIQATWQAVREWLGY